MRFLQPDIGLDILQRNMPGPLDHDLNIPVPRPLRQFAQHKELLHLTPVRGVGQASRPQAVAQTQHHVVSAGDLKQPVVLFVKRIFAVVAGHPVGRDRPAPAHDAQKPALCLEAADAVSRHAAVHRDKIDAVLAVFFNRPEQIVGGHLHDRPPFGQHLRRRLVDGHRSDNRQRRADDRFPDGPDIAPRWTDP